MCDTNTWTLYQLMLHMLRLLWLNLLQRGETLPELGEFSERDEAEQETLGAQEEGDRMKAKRDDEERLKKPLERRARLAGKLNRPEAKSVEIGGA